jgi:hypothetical protein
MISILRAILSVRSNFLLIFAGFFFRVNNTKKDLSVKFNLLNHTKPDSLFNYGMKVLVFSE